MRIHCAVNCTRTTVHTRHTYCCRLQCTAQYLHNVHTPQWCYVVTDDWSTKKHWFPSVHMSYNGALPRKQSLGHHCHCCNGFSQTLLVLSIAVVSMSSSSSCCELRLMFTGQCRFKYQFALFQLSFIWHFKIKLIQNWFLGFKCSTNKT